MSASVQDRALAAVRRVRSARETDSRIGLTQALAELRRQQAEAARAAERLAAAPRFAAGSAGDFQVHLLHLGALAHDRQRAEVAVAGGRTVADESTRRWQQDKTDLRAVELLLDRRAAERAAERDRREARELDDLAAQGWLRRAAEQQQEEGR